MVLTRNMLNVYAHRCQLRGGELPPKTNLKWSIIFFYDRYQWSNAPIDIWYKFSYFLKKLLTYYMIRISIWLNMLLNKKRNEENKPHLKFFVSSKNRMDFRYSERWNHFERSEKTFFRCQTIHFYSMSPIQMAKWRTCVSYLFRRSSIVDACVGHTDAACSPNTGVPTYRRRVCSSTGVLK